MGLVIVGGTGFLGRHICEAAAARGVGATIVSSRPDHRFLAGLSGDFTGAELGSDEAQAALDGADVVIHTAHRSRPSANAESAEIRENVEAATELFTRLAERRPGARVIYVSSGGQIYGGGHTAPIPETAPAAPETPYALGKHLIEQTLFYFARKGRLRATILRAANPVGRWQLGGRHGLVSAVVQMTLEDRPVTLFGAGENVRDYFDADDFGAFLADLAIGDAPEGVFNIGSGVGLTERQIIDAVSAALGQAPKLETRPARGFDLPYAVLDTSKAERELGWRAATPLDATIRELAAALGA